MGSSAAQSACYGSMSHHCRVHTKVDHDCGSHGCLQAKEYAKNCQSSDPFCGWHQPFGVIRSHSSFGMFWCQQLRAVLTASHSTPHHKVQLKRPAEHCPCSFQLFIRINLRKCAVEPTSIGRFVKRQPSGSTRLTKKTNRNSQDVESL